MALYENKIDVAKENIKLNLEFFYSYIILEAMLSKKKKIKSNLYSQNNQEPLHPT